MEQKELQQQRYQIGWRGSCWSISAEYRDLKLGLYPTRDFRIMIELKGVGGLPEHEGIVARFDTFVQLNRGEPGVDHRVAERGIVM